MDSLRDYLAFVKKRNLLLELRSRLLGKMCLSWLSGFPIHARCCTSNG